MEADRVMEEFFKAAALLFVLLNPFLMSIYLVDLIRELDALTFRRVLTRGAVISCAVFILFAWVGDVIFTDILQARFASFLIFGGTVFFVIGLRFVFSGSETFKALRGEPEHLGGSIAMPFMIGPGTVSASVLAGSRLSKLHAAAAIAAALCAVVASIVFFKWLHDYLKQRNERLIERYLEVTGRMMALLIGTFAVEMILQGVETWLGIQRGIGGGE
jgi:small neutral amino acid transporter SnatA (MarC family)